jgi:hypothetical protein
LEQRASTLGQALIGHTLIGQALIGPAMIGPAMIAAWTLVAVAFIALVILAYVAIRNRTRRVDLEETVQAFRSLDIEAFRNLVDPAEEAYLSDHLPPRKFREIKRQRAWAALLYAWEAGRAATALARIGQAAQRSLDPEIAASGVQVAEDAFRLRLQSVRVSLRLLTEVLLPGLSSRSLPSLDQYDRAAETLFRLGRFPSRVDGLVRSKSA